MVATQKTSSPSQVVTTQKTSTAAGVSGCDRHPDEEPARKARNTWIFDEPGMEVHRPFERVGRG